MEKKSVRSARMSEVTAAEGTSIMMPVGTSSLNAMAFPCEVRLHLLHDLVDGVELCRARDQGKHDPQGPVDGRPQERAELGAQDIGAREAEADGAPSQERIVVRG